MRERFEDAVTVAIIASVTFATVLAVAFAPLVVAHWLAMLLQGVVLVGMIVVLIALVPVALLLWFAPQLAMLTGILKNVLTMTHRE